MFMKIVWRAVTIVAVAWMARATADVVSYTATAENGRTVLTSVTAERDGRAVIFDAAKLIPVHVTHFTAKTPRIGAVPVGFPPEQFTPDAALGLDLNAGLVNPGGQEADLTAAPVLDGPNPTPGMAFTFATPVVNLPGDDVVLFELQIVPGCPVEGDPVRVAPLEWREGLRQLTITAYDIQWDHPKARALADFDMVGFPAPPASLQALMEGTPSRVGGGGGFKALAVAIDLSDLGYGPGEEVAGLFLQNVLPGEPAVDPVCIAGLPEPVAPNVLDAEPRTLDDDPSLLADQFLESPDLDFEDIVFAVRTPGNDHWYANFGYYSSPVREYPPQRAPEGITLPPVFKEGGGQLCRLNVRSGEVTVILDDPNGSVRDPEVHYDGGKILFSYRKDGSPYFNLYEINVDGSGLTQLTDGPFNDIEPCYLPDGGIMFCSDRSLRFVNCWITPVATLYRCEADGSGIRMISTNIEHDNTPAVLPDGRVLFMRWEYVDRSQYEFHHLWTVNPDGTGQMTYFGNERPGGAFLDAKPIPGTKQVVMSLSPGHGRPEHEGYVTVVDPALGPDAKRATRISKGGPEFRDPYPLSSHYFLAARKGEVVLMDQHGHAAPLYTLGADDAKRFCHEPRPLRPRQRERVIPSRVHPDQPSGRFFLADVYKGRNMEGVQRGDIKELLVLEQLPKPVSFSGGMWPISIGGTFTLARILGTVPVEPDGSACFDVPAMRSVFFVALDKHGMAVKRMQSFVSAMPGEFTGCVGCHERRTNALPTDAALLEAMRRAPSPITPIAHVPEVPDFPRDVQPILDKHCVPCHSPEKLSGDINLCGDHTPLFSESYWTMVEHGLISDGRDEGYGNRPPRTIGSSASPLLQKLDGTHHDVKVSDAERDTVRLWVDASAPYAGTYAALGSGMFPVKFPVEAIERRCGACHGQPPPEKNAIYPHQYFAFGKGELYTPLVHEFLDLQQIRALRGYYKYGQTRPPQSLCNITRPEMSMLLRAPLSKAAGGFGRCGEEVFTNADDADYQAILAAIRASSAKEQAELRFDMPGFRPNDYYIYQMQRYGVLPQDLKPEDPVNAYEADQAYWRLFWHPGQER